MSPLILLISILSAITDAIVYVKHTEEAKGAQPSAAIAATVTFMGRDTPLAKLESVNNIDDYMSEIVQYLTRVYNEGTPPTKREYFITGNKVTLTNSGKVGKFGRVYSPNIVESGVGNTIRSYVDGDATQFRKTLKDGSEDNHNAEKVGGNEEYILIGYMNLPGDLTNKNFHWNWHPFPKQLDFKYHNVFGQPTLPPPDDPVPADFRRASTYSDIDDENPPVDLGEDGFPDETPTMSGWSPFSAHREYKDLISGYFGQEEYYNKLIDFEYENSVLNAKRERAERRLNFERKKLLRLQDRVNKANDRRRYKKQRKTAKRRTYYQ